MAQHEMDWLKEGLQQLEQEMEAKEQELLETTKAKEVPELITIIKDEKERLVVKKKDLWQQLTGLQDRLASPPGATLTAKDVLGLRSIIYRHKAEKLSISSIKVEEWETIKVTARLKFEAWLRAMNPMSQHQPKPFWWEDNSPESSQSDRYLSFLQQELSSVLGRGMHSRIEVLDANRYPNCLATRGLEGVFGYNFNGSTDILLAYREAVRIKFPETASVAAFVLKKGQVTREHVMQACVTLITLNLKSAYLRPWVLLTDLKNIFIFLWMDGPTIYYYPTEDACSGWSIIMDLLQRDASVTFADPGEQEAASVPILARKEIPAELGWPRAVLRQCRQPQ